MTSQNIAESPLNITSILNNFKYFIKQVYQKNGSKNIKQKGSKLLLQNKIGQQNWPTYVCPSRNWQFFYINTLKLL